MKLLFLNLYSGAVERGAESFAHELADRLGECHQVNFIKGNSSLQPQSQFSGSLLNKLLKRLFLDQPGREVLSFSLKQIPHILQSNYDVIFPLNGFWQLLMLKIFQPFKGYKIIVTGNSGPGWDERWNLYLKPNYFIATTGPTLNWANHTCPYTKSILIPYAINPKKLKPSSRNPGVNNPGVEKLPRPIILCPSALVPYKQVDLAINAVSKLEKGSLLVLGKGPQETELTNLGQELLGNRFHLTSVKHQDIAPYYDYADLLTLPSLPQENSPMVFIEALAANKMVVATDTPRNRWMLEDSGVYTNPQEVSHYSRALMHALKQKPNTKKALKKFTWESVIKKYNKIINE